MTIARTLIERLSSETGQRLTALARSRRQRGLVSLSRFYVVVADDGLETRETMFVQPPTLGELIDKVGAEVFVVAVQMRRKPLTTRIRHAIAAE